MGLDSPAADGDLFDDEAEEPLAGLEVEGGGDPLGEAGEPLPQAVVAGELGALLAQGEWLRDERCSATRWTAAPAAPMEMSC